MDIEKVLCERRSVRKFSDKQVPKEVLERILKCGTYAPSGRGKQAAVIVAIQDQELIKKIGKVNGKFFMPLVDPFYGAPTLVIVFADKSVGTYLYDGCAVISNIVNAAYGLGVDSCWIHRACEVFETDFGQELMKKWGLNENYEGIGNIILGYRSGDLPKAKTRKENYIIYNEPML